MIFHAFLIKYAEIAIKGKNRYLFEDALVKQMKLALEPVEGEFTVTKEQGRVYVFCPEKYDFDEAVEALQRVFGIVGISPVVIYEDQDLTRWQKMSYLIWKQDTRDMPEASKSTQEEPRNPTRSLPWKSAQESEKRSWMHSRRHL